MQCSYFDIYFSDFFTHLFRNEKYAALNEASQKVVTNETDILALTMIQTGVIPDELGGMIVPQVIVAGKYM